MDKVRAYAKFIVALVGAAINAGALALLPDQYKVYVGIGIAVLTAISVYAVPNRPAEAGP